MTVNSISILIAHELSATRCELRRTLAEEPEVTVVGEADEADEAMHMLERLHPDVILADLPLTRKVQRARTSAKNSAQVRILVLLTAMERGQIVDAFRLGADGVALRDASQLVLLKSIRGVSAGTYWLEGEGARVLVGVLREVLSQQSRTALTDYGLTPRELEIVAKIASGHSNREVGRDFSISERTVKHHLTNIFSKVGVSNRLELALFAMNHRLEALTAPRQSESSLEVSGGA